MYLSREIREGGMPVIGGGGNQHLLHAPPGMGKGYVRRDYKSFPLGCYSPQGSFSRHFPLIPRNEWADRVAEMERDAVIKSNLREPWGFRSLNQGKTNYCWAAAPTQTMHYARARAGLPHVQLSTASVAAPIKGYRNVGGWGSQAFEYAAKNGWAPADLWPEFAIERRYDIEESRRARQLYKPLEFWELTPRNFDELFTAMLMGFTVAIGLMWWGHEVTVVDPVVLGRNKWGGKIDNSWGQNYGVNGFAVLTEDRLLGDDIVALRTPTMHVPE